MHTGREAAKCWEGIGMDGGGTCVHTGGGGPPEQDTGKLVMEMGSMPPWWVSGLCQEPCSCVSLDEVCPLSGFP